MTQEKLQLLQKHGYHREWNTAGFGALEATTLCH